MKEFAIRVLSSDGDRSYSVLCTEDSGWIRMHCGCTAGEFGKACKHKDALMRGDASVLLDSGELAALETLQSLIPSSQLPLLLERISEVETRLNEAKQALRQARSQLETSIRMK